MSESMHGLFWASCSAETDWSTSLYRHLSIKDKDGWIDTLCGATGTPGAMRGSFSKQDCPVCKKRYSQIYSDSDD